MEGALSHITALPSTAVERKVSNFVADGVADDFVVVEPGKIEIQSVFVDGLRATEGVHYNKDNATKTATFLPGQRPPAGLLVDVTYFPV